jgi:hypothetical protein
MTGGPVCGSVSDGAFVAGGQRATDDVTGRRRARDQVRSSLSRILKTGWRTSPFADLTYSHLGQQLQLHQISRVKERTRARPARTMS